MTVPVSDEMLCTFFDFKFHGYTVQRRAGGDTNDYLEENES